MDGRRPVDLVGLVLLVTIALAQTSCGREQRSSVEAPPDACVAGPDAEQQDVDAEDAPEHPWPSAPGRRVTVYFAADGLPPRYVHLLEQAAALWAPSPCVNPVVADRCPPGSHCSTVTALAEGRDGSTDGESESVDRRGVRVSNSIRLYTALLDNSSDNGALATIVHEMGHAFGLMHRNDPDSVMNAKTTNSTDPAPDEVDFANLVAIYGRRS
jgi:Matrixin